MKTIKLSVVLALCLFTPKTYAQQHTSQTVTFGLTSHALVGVNVSTLDFTFAAPTVAGDGLGTQSVDASTQLYYSFLPSSPINGNSNGAKVKVNFIGIPSGMSVALTVDGTSCAALSSTVFGDLGTVVSGFTTGATLSTGATDIIEGIGSSYTGTSYYDLTYSATIDDYSNLSSTFNGPTPVIQYTITQ